MNDYISNLISDKYNNKLIDYKYYEHNNINNQLLNYNTHIKYISKKNLVMKSGYITDILNNSIIKLSTINKNKIWFIYIDQYYIFYNNNIIHKNNISKKKLKNTLKDLIKNNFSIK